MKNWKRALAMLLTVILMVPVAVSEEAFIEEGEIAVSQSIESAVSEQGSLQLEGEAVDSPEIPEEEKSGEDSAREETPGNDVPQEDASAADAAGDEANLPDEPEAESAVSVGISEASDASPQNAFPTPQVRDLTVSGNTTESVNVDDTLRIYVSDAAPSVTKWTSSNKKVATVTYNAGRDSFATVKAVKAGTAKLTAKLNDKTFKKLVVTLKVNDPYQPSSLSFKSSDVTLKPGSTLVLDDYLSVAPNYISASQLVWSSSKKTVASVSMVDGKLQLTALAKGSAKITAASRNKKVKAVLRVTVPDNKLTKMTAKPKTADIAALNGSWTLWPISIEPNKSQLVCKFYLLNGTGDKVKTLEDFSIGIATGTPGHVIAANHYTRVSASCGKNKSKSLTFKLPLLESTGDIFLPDHYAAGTLFFVLDEASARLTSAYDAYAFVRNPHLPMAPAIPVTDITLSQGAATLIVGQTLQLTASVKPEDAGIRSVLWSSSDPSVASVENGLITALSKGNVAITATAADGSGVTARCRVSVFESVTTATGITLSQNTAALNVGAKLVLTATVAPDTVTDPTVTWSSSDSTIAQVSDGVVTGMAAGTAVITARTHNGLTDRCTVTVSNVPVTGVSLTRTSATLRLGETLSLVATVEPDTATDQTLTWRSSNTSVATVSDGTVTGVAEGRATITATANGGSGVSAQCEITVLPAQVQVTSVKLSSPTGRVMMGDTLQLSAEVQPASATNKNLLWSSDDTSIATVVDGLVTGVGKGTTRITAAAADGSGKSGTCTITVNYIPVAGIHLSTTDASLKVPEKLTLKAAVSPANASYQNVVWRSSDESIATVDEDGTVTGVNSGTATITAEAVDGSSITAVCRVTVQRIALTGIALTQTSATLGVGGSLQLYATATPEDASDKSVTWSSSDSAIATVTEDGQVKGVAPGSAVITATSRDGGFTATCSVSISVAEVTVSSVNLDRTEASVQTGDQLTLVPTVLPANASNPALSWTSDNPEVASVIGGVVTGIAPGTAIITATATDGSGATSSCLITVNGTVIPLTGIALDMTSTKLGIGESLILEVTAQPENAPFHSVTWKSSNDGVAIVNNAGLITAVSEGTAKITITAHGDDNSTATASCNITVVSVPIYSITLAAPDKPLLIGSTLQLTPTILPANATNRKLEWTSSDTNIVSVSDGLLTANAGGVVTLTATAQDGSNVKASCQISVTTSTMTASVSDLTLKVGENQIVTMSYSATTGSLKSYTSNKSIASTAWGKWSNRKIDLTITALAEGTATVIVANTANDETWRIHVTVLPSDSKEEPVDPSIDGNVTYRALLIGEEAFSPKCTRNRGDVTLMTKMLNSVKGPAGGTFTIAQKFDLNKTGVLNAISSTFSGADEDDVSLFFIATHGDVKNSGEHAGALKLISPSSGSESYIQMGELAKALQAVPGKVIVFIESCGSGAGVYTSDAEQNGEDVLEIYEDAAEDFNTSVVGAFAAEDVSRVLNSFGDIVSNTGEFRVENKFYVLTASRYQEESYGTERGPYNYFTKWLTNGIGTTGKMPADTNGDGNGVTTLNELFKYISKVGDNFGFTPSGKTGTFYQHVQVYPANSSYKLFKR